jgi:thioesterase domain-containing protein
MSQVYADLIVSHRPTGPYWLFGFSFGGVIALQTAHALEDAGHDVGFVGLAECDLRWSMANVQRLPMLSSFLVAVVEQVGRDLALSLTVSAEDLELEAQRLAQEFISMESSAAAATRMMDWVAQHAVNPEE